MSLALDISHNLDELLRKLARDLTINPLSSVLAPNVFVTQTEGMNKWMSLELSRGLGVFTNFKFHKPNTFLSDIFRLAGIIEEQDFSTEKLRWSIYDIFDEVKFQEDFHEIAQYYQGDDVKRLQLATRVADLFDQYLIYRPDYIDLWNEGKEASIPRKGLKYHEQWQRQLWNRLKERDDFEDKVDLRRKLKSAFDNPDFIKRLKSRYGTVSLFGLSVFTQFHLDLFLKLSEYINLNFYLLNPAPNQFWYDETNEKSILKISRFEAKSKEELLLTSGNQLLSNWGKIGKDTFSSLFESDEFLNQMTVLDHSKVERSSLLLSHIQHDVLQNIKEHDQDKLKGLVNDGSILVNKCYTPIREVEVFHDYLLSLFDESDLAVHDVIVLVNDINEYAPFISAVFDNAKQKIPYSIADQSYTKGETITSFLELLLPLREDEFTADKVFQFLEFDFIRVHYGITEVEDLRRVVKDVNIRFGINGNKSVGTDILSWNNGFDKLILGYCLGNEEAVTVKGKIVYPNDMLEGDQFNQLLKLKMFVDDLIDVMQSRQFKSTLDDWQSYLQLDILDRFITVTENLTEEYQVVLQHIHVLGEVKELTSKVSYQVFQKAFLDSLVNNVKASHFVTGRVTFCSMIPMRSIPFKVVAILGLNSGVFPRVEDRLAFDLMNAERRRGDRDVKESDKYLFLETLCSAQERFYLSYIGKNVKDNRDKPPSILIDALLDYIFDGDEKAVESFVLEHPLFSYSSKYNNGGRLRTYKNATRQRIAFTRNEEVVPFGFDSDDHFEFSNLIKYFKDSAGYYFKEQYGLYFVEEDLELPEEESFSIDGLTKHFLKVDLLEGNATDTTNKYQNSGKIPLLNLGKAELKASKARIHNFNEVVSRVLDNPVVTLNVRCKVDNKEISYHVGNIVNGYKVGVAMGEREEKYSEKVLKDLLEYYLLRAAGYDLGFKFYYEAFGGKPVTILQSDISVEDANMLLCKLITKFESRNEEVFVYSPLFFQRLYKVDNKTGKYSEKSQKMTKSFLVDNLSRYNEYLKKLDAEGYFGVYSTFDWTEQRSITKLLFQHALPIKKLDQCL